MELSRVYGAFEQCLIVIQVNEKDSSINVITASTYKVLAN